LKDGVGERAGDGHVVAAGAYERVAVTAGDLVDGHGGDAGQQLSVGQGQAACNPAVSYLPGTSFEV
jgi:hypothetical protein